MNQVDQKSGIGSIVMPNKYIFNYVHLFSIMRFVVINIVNNKHETSVSS